MDGRLLEIEKDGNWIQSNFSKMKEKYPNQFIAVKNQEIIASGKKIEKVIEIVKKKGENPALILVEFIFDKKLGLIL